MTIGNWEVTIVREETFENQPGNPAAGSQRMVFYNFKYVPENYSIPFMIHYVKFVPDDEVLNHLTAFTGQLKTAFIDPRSN